MLVSDTVMEQSLTPMSFLFLSCFANILSYVWGVRGTYLYLRRATEAMVPCAQGRTGRLCTVALRRLWISSFWGVAR